MPIFISSHFPTPTNPHTQIPQTISFTNSSLPKFKGVLIFTEVKNQMKSQARKKERIISAITWREVAGRSSHIMSILIAQGCWRCSMIYYCLLDWVGGGGSCQYILSFILWRWGCGDFRSHKAIWGQQDLADSIWLSDFDIVIPSF